MKRTIMAAVLVLAFGAALSACETATPYQPLKPGSAQAGGYTETQLEANRWRVTFQGNSLTSRPTVENYLLFRASELTLDKGYDWFEMVQRHTDKHTSSYVEPIGPYGGWRPYWRYYGGGRGWRTWDPFWGGPFWADDLDIQTIERYEASAEFVMGHGAKPEGDARAFDARQVQANLGAKIVRPS
jgi:hypothetical protein